MSSTSWLCPSPFRWRMRRKNKRRTRLAFTSAIRSAKSGTTSKRLTTSNVSGSNTSAVPSQLLPTTTTSRSAVVPAVGPTRLRSAAGRTDASAAESHPKRTRTVSSSTSATVASLCDASQPRRLRAPRMLRAIVVFSADPSVDADGKGSSGRHRRRGMGKSVWPRAERKKLTSGGRRSGDAVNGCMAGSLAERSRGAHRSRASILSLPRFGG